MNSKEYQNLTIELLANKLPELEVIGEWIAFRRIHYQYSPRVDIAVGPFSINPNDNQTDEYNRIIEQPNINILLKLIYNYHIENIGHEWMNELDIPDFKLLIHKNLYARCFLAIEIENSSTRKHIMGSMINAASLGRIGIGIAFNNSVMKKFLRILNYLAFLKRVEKNTYDATNFLILTKEQFKGLLI